jgi:hypothetical protein
MIHLLTNCVCGQGANTPSYCRSISANASLFDASAPSGYDAICKHLRVRLFVGEGLANRRARPVRPTPAADTFAVVGEERWEKVQKPEDTNRDMAVGVLR